MATIREVAQDVPVVAEVDVAVVGGGTAGIGAALGAARAGSEVVLVEAHGSLGGQMTLGNVTMIPGDWDYDPGSATGGGVMTEIVQRLRQEDAIWPKERLSREFKNYDSEICKWVAIDLMEKAGVHMRLHSWVSNAVVGDKGILAIILDTVAGRQAVRARSFIDATGDGLLAHLSGASCSGASMGISLCAKLFIPDLPAFEAWVRGLGQPLSAWLKANGSTVHVGSQVNILMPGLRHISQSWPVPGSMYGDIDGLDVTVLTGIENASRTEFKRLVDLLRTHAAGCRDAVLVETSEHLGVRATRQVLGDHVLARNEVAECLSFPDTVVRLGPAQRPYEIPYRSLYSRDIQNLWVAGRCFSCTKEVQSELRVIPTCVCTGEAAGPQRPWLHSKVLRRATSMWMRLWSN